MQRTVHVLCDTARPGPSYGPPCRKFPFGLANLTAYIHSKGLLAGIYTDVAWRTCANYEGSGPGPSDPVGHWPLDALTFAQWGFDMIEVRTSGQG